MRYSICCQIVFLLPNTLLCYNNGLLVKCSTLFTTHLMGMNMSSVILWSRSNLPQPIMFILCSSIFVWPSWQYNCWLVSPASPLCCHSCSQRISQPQSKTTSSKWLDIKRIHCIKFITSCEKVMLTYLYSCEYYCLYILELPSIKINPM